jgi:predicted SAM-dependent methyltransferase
MKLNLGCGDKYIPGFVNIDYYPRENCKPDLIGNIVDLDSMGLGNIEEIVAYDIIEHFDRTQIIPILKNWYDHLAPNGVLYIRTNDLDRMIALYQEQPQVFPVDTFIWHLMCEHEKPGMGHKWCFTRKNLFNSLLEVGFNKIRMTYENDILLGNYPYSFTDCDRCNMHMIATKI